MSLGSTKLLVFLTVLLLVTNGCGGGGNSGSSGSPATDQDPVRGKVLWIFGNGDGVARAENSSATVHTIATGITDVVNFVNNNNSDSSTLNSGANSLPELFNDSNEADVLTYGITYRGVIEQNMVFANAIGYRSRDSRTLFYIIEATEGRGMYVLGEKLSNIPLGTFGYNGFNVLVENTYQGSSLEYGTFNMSVDFTREVGSVSAITTNSRLAGSFNVDGEEGYIFGSNLNFTVNNRNRSASIYGSFHSNGASAVTGVYHENVSNPRYQGAIVGTNARLRTN